MVGITPASNATPNTTPCKNRDNVRSAKERDDEKQTIAGRQEEVGQPEIDGQSEQETDGRQQPDPGWDRGPASHRAVRHPASAHTTTVGAIE